VHGLGGLSLSLIGIALLVLFARGPHSSRWLGWDGGWSILPAAALSSSSPSTRQEAGINVDDASGLAGEKPESQSGNDAFATTPYKNAAAIAAATTTVMTDEANSSTGTLVDPVAFASDQHQHQRQQHDSDETLAPIEQESSVEDSRAATTSSPNRTPASSVTCVVEMPNLN
jgi:hypothetical protein